MRRQQRCWLWCSVFVLGYLLWRGFPFFIDTIPLGYDPGLYKAMMLAYHDLGQWWDFSQLPGWIRGMYEPLLGMRVSIGQKIIGSRSDQVLLWGWVVISGLLPLGAYLCGSLWGRRVGLFAVVGVFLSFVQYELFWRAYRKQLIGMFFLLVCLRGWMRGLRRSLIPLICAIVLVSRPVAIVGLLCGLLILGQTIKKQGRREVGVLLLVFVCSMIVVLPVLGPFLDSLIVPLIGPFFEAIDLPQWHDTFQAGGTFLTIREYLITARPILISGSIGAVLLIMRRQGVIFGWMVIVLSIRVFGQFYFFQRMIGILDLFLVLSSAYLYGQWWSSRRGKITVLLLLASSALISMYRISRTYRPIIEREEFAFLSQIGRYEEKDAVIIVPGIWYSPRVQGRVGGSIIAPGLFDNRWGDLDQTWLVKWTNATGEEKCIHLATDFADWRDRPRYLRIGSKQPRDALDGGCFQLITSNKIPYFAWYRVDLGAYRSTAP